MKKSKGRNKNRKKPGIARRGAKRQFLPALAAVGGACGLATTPASAIELGSVRIDSALGQPLRASIAYALAPNEDLYDYCIFLNRGVAPGGMPAVSDARITITDTAIVLNGRVPVREPMLSLRLSVDCAYTARLARDYTLFIDPVLSSEGERAVLSTERPPMTPVQVATVESSDIPAAVTPSPRISRRVSRPQDGTPIPASSRYIVKTGDSLSQIAARIEGRSIALWPAVESIFAANPHAFVDNDPNLLTAGSWLDIPDLSGAAPLSVADNAAATPRRPAPSADAYSAATPAATPEPADRSQSPVVEPAPEPAPVAATAGEAEPAGADSGPQLVAEPAEPPVAETRRPELRPGDFVIGSDNPFVVPLGDDIVDIPDSTIEGPQVSRPVPSVAVTEADDGGSGWAWLLWLGGAGIALILGLFMFGRQIRERFGAKSYAIPDVPSRRRDDQPTPRSIVADIDFNFDSDTLTPRKIELDADLADGSGLQDAAELDVAQDFGYSATDTSVDVEIPEEAAREEKPSPTDVIPPTLRDTHTILDSEVLPEPEDEVLPDLEEEVLPELEDDEDYSLNMEVDATKQLLDDNTATTKDLQAILVSTDVRDADSVQSGDDSLSKQMDYQILEQDYEEELTATQALNKEIEDAARALAEQMGNDTGITTEMPAAQDPDLTAELTSNLPASGDAENEEFGNTAAAQDLTVDLPAADEDATLDMDAITVEQKKSEAS